METGNFLALGLSLLLATACRATEDPPVFQAVSDKEFKEMEIRVPADSRFVLRLPSLQSAGYAWEFEAPPGEKLLERVAREDEPGPAVRTGAPGWELWTFRAIAPGRIELKLKLRRPWETDLPPQRELLVTVVIGPHG